MSLGISNGILLAASSFITSLGFTSAGIAAASIAAGIQAGIGSVAAGSLFAIVQSLAATGVVFFFEVFAAIGLGIAVIFGAYKLYKYLKKRRQ